MTLIGFNTNYERDRKNTISITKAKEQNLHSPGFKFPGT